MEAVQSSEAASKKIHFVLGHISESSVPFVIFRLTVLIIDQAIASKGWDPIDHWYA